MAKNNFWRGIGGKLIFIGLIVGGLVISSLVVKGKMTDRGVVYDGAVYEIAKSAGDRFDVQGPFIAFPVKHITYTERTIEGQKKIDKNVSESWKTIYAQDLNFVAELDTQERTLGIYSQPIFTGKLWIDGSFDLDFKNTEEWEYCLDRAMIYIMVENSSLCARPVMSLNGKAYDTDNLDELHSILNLRNPCIGNGVAVENGRMDVQFELDIRGARKFMVHPSAKDNYLAVKCDWPSPGFTDFSYLPDERELDENGFVAKWHVPFVDVNSDTSIGFYFVNPVDLYAKLYRSVNYAFLFIIVPFVILFLFEIFRGINLHPLNYLLSGAASVLFFLLLLALSEHMTFAFSYLIAAIVAGLMVSVYLATVTKKFWMGFFMLISFAVLYVYLYVSLMSEDYALLIGAVFLFVLLGAVMFFTRKIGRGKKEVEAVPQKENPAEEK